MYLSRVYDNGYVQPSGLPVVGGSTMSPILDVKNSTGEALHVSWVNQVEYDDDNELDLLGEASQNTVTLLEGQSVLISNLYASKDKKRSVVLLQGESTGLDMATLHFNLANGYHLQSVETHWEGTGKDGEEHIVQSPPGVRIKALLQKPAYALQATGSTAPRWRRAILLPVTVVAQAR